MLTDLHRRQVSHAEIVCTVVGGANVMRQIERRWSVGERNVATATDLLAGEGIRVAHADTGGTRGRTVVHICDLNITNVQYHQDLG
jgi:chemotaxis receptor (MCP) glutamine deamidase CheD